MKLYEFINPSDSYTFEAPNIEIAAATVILISTSYGAAEIGGDEEATPVLLGWGEWLEDHGIDSDFINEHLEEIADAMDSFLIGSASSRKEFELMLKEVPVEKRERVRSDRQNLLRSSMSDIGEFAYQKAKQLRAGIPANN